MRVVSLLADAVIADFSATGNGLHVDTAFVVGSKTVPYPIDRS